MTIEVLIIIAVLIGAGLYIFKRMTQVSPEVIHELVAKGAVVIDVRDEDEFAQGHAPEAINLPMHAFQAGISEVVPNKETPVLLYCLSGGRSAMAARALKQAGYSTVENLGSLGRAGQLLGE